MSTFKPLATLFEDMPPERVDQIRERAQQMSAAIRLAEVRKRHKTTQQFIAERMQVSQSSISQIESQGDMQLSTLLRYVHALGGKVSIQIEIDGEQTTLLQG